MVTRAFEEAGCATFAPAAEFVTDAARAAAPRQPRHRRQRENRLMKSRDYRPNNDGDQRSNRAKSNAATLAKRASAEAEARPDNTRDLRHGAAVTATSKANRPASLQRLRSNEIRSCFALARLPSCVLRISATSPLPHENLAPSFHPRYFSSFLSHGRRHEALLDST